MQNFQMISFSNLFVIMKIDMTNWNKNKEFIIVVQKLLTKHKYRRIFFFFNKKMMWRNILKIELWCEYYYCRHDIF
jgi:hypothetical protein